MIKTNSNCSDDLSDCVNNDVVGIAAEFAAAQNMIACAFSASRDQLTMGHMQHLTAIVAMAETARQVKGCSRRDSVDRAVNEALDLLRQALAPGRD